MRKRQNAGFAIRVGFIIVVTIIFVTRLSVLSVLAEEPTLSLQGNLTADIQVSMLSGAAEGPMFSDVPSTHWACGFIEEFAVSGVTGGCFADDPVTTENEAKYCPEDAVTRSQMAVFIEVSLGVALDQLPSCGGTVFGDVKTDTVGDAFCRFIEDFAARGITGGCGGGNYCPGNPVTRQQMGVFLEAAMGRIPDQLPSLCSGIFTDVGSATEQEQFVCRIIEDFAGQGITGGCSTNPPQYCPNEPVTRAQMAVFLMAAPLGSANRPPAVNAGPDLEITLSGSATLDGTVTDDGLPNPPGAVTTTWIKVSGPGTVTFGDASAIDTTASFSVAGTYVLRLTANDGHLSASDEMSVVVTGINNPPMILVSRSGAGSGTVTGPGIDCGTDCTETYTSGTSVTLTASAAAGSTFAGWTGCDSVSGNTCTVTMALDRTVTAAFSHPLPSYMLSVIRVGTGTVTGNGISCGSDCSQSFLSGTSVALSATAGTGWVFLDWSGCDSVLHGQCTFRMDGDRTVAAGFAPEPSPGYYVLGVGRVGQGTVRGSGIVCGTDCLENYRLGTVVNLTATPAAGWSLSSWSGCGSTSGNTCTVTMNRNHGVVATFTSTAPSSYNLFVDEVGTGNGTVTSTGPGISCPTDCTQSYTGGTSVTLTASAAAGSTFAGWTGCDSTSGNTCTVSMNQNRTVTATFNASPPTLTVSKSGTGSGTVTGTGIDCGTDCTETYTSGTSVTLTASASPGSTFGSWTGCNSASGNTCTVTMNQSKTVTASFTAAQTSHTLTVNKSGSGTVTGPGIDCGANCTESVPTGTSVTLTATLTGCSVSAGWTNCDSTSGLNCTVAMSQDRTVTATFNSGFTTRVDLSLPATDNDGTYTLTWTAQCLSSSNWQIEEAPTADFTNPARYSTSNSYYNFTNKPDGTYCYRVNGSQPKCITVTLPTAAVLRIENSTHYDMVEIQLNNQQMLAYPSVIPVGGTGTVSYSLGGTVDYQLGVGIYDYDLYTGWYALPWFTLTGRTSVAAGQTTTLRFDNPTLGQLLTNFNSSGCDWIGQYWCTTCNPIVGYAKFHINPNGSWSFYDNNVLRSSGSATLVSWPDRGYVVQFRLEGGGPVVDLAWPWGIFYYNNGPADWPRIEYVGNCY
jgi:hypothetical protein